MTFLYPAFLAALAVLLIPVIIHLFRFRKYKTVRFTRVAFLRSAALETKNRSKLKHLLTLLARLLALTSLVLAFAMPSCNQQGQAEGGKTAVSLYVDNSFSMGTGSDGKILLEAAKNSAREIVRSFGDRGVFQIISGGIGAAQQDYVTAGEALKKIDDIAISPEPATLDQIIKRMRETLLTRPEKGRGFVISDFQKSFCRDLSVTSSGAAISLIRIEREIPDNIALDSAWTEQAFLVPGEKNRLMFRVKNYTKSRLEDLPVKMLSNGSLAGIGKVSADPGAAVVAGIDFTPGSEQLVPSELKLEESGLAFDNQLFLDLSAGETRNILMSGNNRYVEAVIASQLFLKKSLSTPIPGKKGKWNEVWIEPAFGDLNADKVNAFLDWASAGATVILAPAEGKAPVSLLQKLGLPKSEWVPGKFRISQTGFSHPFFNRIFRQVPANMEMPLINKYFSTSGQAGSGEIILSLENGDPLLLSFPSGQGRIYLFTSNLDAGGGNWVNSSLFLPVLTNAFVSAEKSGTLYGIAGSGSLMPLKLDQVKSEALVLKSNKSQIVPEIQRGNTGISLYLGREPSKAGVYELSDPADKSEKQVVAVNYSRAESDPAVASNTELEPAMKKGGLSWLDQGKTAAASSKIAGEGLWRWFVALAALFFLAEVLILVFWDKWKGSAVSVGKTD